MNKANDKPQTLQDAIKTGALSPKEIADKMQAEKIAANLAIEEKFQKLAEEARAFHKANADAFYGGNYRAVIEIRSYDEKGNYEILGEEFVIPLSKATTKNGDAKALNLPITARADGRDTPVKNAHIELSCEQPVEFVQRDGISAQASLTVKIGNAECLNYKGGKLVSETKKAAQVETVSKYAGWIKHNVRQAAQNKAKEAQEKGARKR